MKPIRLHRRVYDDIDEALAVTRAEFGARQVPIYERLIVEGRLTLHLARYLPDLISPDF
jgi:hypothetical protein